MTGRIVCKLATYILQNGVVSTECVPTCLASHTHPNGLIDSTSLPIDCILMD